VISRLSFVADQVDGHADGQVAAHGRVKRDQHAFGRFGKAGGRRDHAIDDGFTVFGFARLEKRGVEPGFDEIALGVDPEQSWLFALDLTAENERSVEADIAYSR
jgi:hypothetical protein